ncbi:pentatricopeptide repeat-containing protein At2g13600 [Cryptomeria japonica]|uniref:pentatricopeptide repeat-containing protein At2g13600 n=1 Tax=Cryptomeria japonica TaxID=3369 RepID=UPI0025ABDC8F|nr:pentatricopeptide repeat-containing protein At2g13600 [Cryptomeria japonica]
MKQKQIHCFLSFKSIQQNKHIQYFSAAAQSHLVESGKLNNVLNDSTQGRIEVDVRTSRKILEEGRSLHAAIIKIGFELEILWQNHILNVYAKCRRIRDARQVFDKMPERNLVSWSAMVTGYAQNGCGEEAVKVFREMQREGINPSEFAYASVSRACASLAIAEEGDEIHAQAIKTGYNLNVFVGSALVDMYAKCGIMENARKLFDRLPQRNVVSWTGIIAGYLQDRNEIEVLNLFWQMQKAGTKPNQFTSSCVLSACANLQALEEGKQVHSDVIKSGLELDIFVGNSLIDMYAKCTRLEDARQVFEMMPEKDVISWNAMIAAYSQNNQGEEAMKMFRRMQWAVVKQDEIRFSAVLGACASLAALRYGKQIHSNIIKSGLESDLYAGNALVDMYAKCGGVEDACQVFNLMQEHDVVSWNAVILGCAQHGHGKKAIQLFGEMQEAGVEPDHVTFISVLSACNHSGLVDEGRRYFNSMTQEYGIARRIEHHACMIDLLGRARHLDEAYNLIVSMPFEPDSRMWGSLIGACRIHRNIELGIIAAESLLDLEPQNAGIRVLLSNIYAEAGRWDDVRKVRKMMKDTRVVKEPGQSWIEIKESVHVFYAEDQSLLQT